MTADQLRIAMEQAAKAKSMEFAGMAAELDESAKTELKALKISCNIADICKKFTSFFLGDEEFYSRRETMVAKQFSSGDFEDFGDYINSYDVMNKEQKELFLVYAYPVMSIRCNFINNRKPISQSNLITEKEAAAEFESRIIKRVAGEIIKEWTKLWREHGFPAEKAGEV